MCGGDFSLQCRSDQASLAQPGALEHRLPIGGALHWVEMVMLKVPELSTQILQDAMYVQDIFKFPGKHSNICQIPYKRLLFPCLDLTI